MMNEPETPPTGVHAPVTLFPALEDEHPVTPLVLSTEVPVTFTVLGTISLTVIGVVGFPAPKRT